MGLSNPDFYFKSNVELKFTLKAEVGTADYVIVLYESKNIFQKDIKSLSEVLGDAKRIPGSSRSWSTMPWPRRRRSPATR